MSIPSFIQENKILFEEQLKLYLKKNSFNTVPQGLYEAFCYTVLAPAKRIRPVLLYLVGEMLGIEKKVLDPFACAIEFLHTYSLVHDDLPAMDDDDFRRGLPSCHYKYGEATAILVGDALQNEAYACLATVKLEDPQKLFDILKLFAQCSGLHGMVAGQYLDIVAREKIENNTNVRDKINVLKTGKLFYLVVMLGALCIKESLDLAHYEALGHYALALGKMFQAKDDLLDHVQDNKIAVAKVQGIELKEIRKRLYSYYDNSNSALIIFGDDATKLLEFNDFLVNRTQ